MRSAASATPDNPKSCSSAVGLPKKSVCNSALFIPVSRFDVTPVIAWWPDPTEVRVMDHGESARVYRVPIADLVAPANRGTFSPPDRAYSTPAFDVGVLRVWGFTAGLLEFALEELGWASDWDREAYIHIQL